MTNPLDTTSDHRPGGGYTARVRVQVRAELAERGYEGLTTEGVATRAEVHRAMVYRCWRDAGGLLIDVIDAAGEIDWQPPNTGLLRGNLTALNQEIQESPVVRPSLAVALMAASFHSERTARAQTRLWADWYARCEILVERAVGCGGLDARHTDARSLLIAATAPLHHQLVLLRADPDPRLPKRAAETAVLAAAAGAFTVHREESV
ncbi:TetR/AcrR family transcriptional regulator C-terminal ligand-binding domain-containing protein [Streptomyces sp. NPDC088752]|uniref:TetR/AcrR family transcriptional regulator n=1 Tax=Streptomyces sp. NPDC088752 TaxID=3154963 RepID=UPI00342D16FE